MAPAVQAIAFDYDGTLTDTPRPRQDVLDAIHATRSRGCAVVLVTGRILSELRADFPDVDGFFDAIVAENGAVLADADGIQDLTEPVDPRLAQALAHRDIPVRTGRVLLACEAEHAAEVLIDVARLGLDCQVVRNRAAMMVLPGGVTKGTGLMHALGNLGISRHSTLAVGDAENDHHLLEVCELRVAVANAVDALKRRADLVLTTPDGAGIVELLGGPLVAGTRTLPPRGWNLTLGTDTFGNPVRIPASQVNVLLTGASNTGKSYVAGLLVEQLVRLGYGVLVVDLEGDHQGLADRRGILGVGGADPLPSAEALAALLRHRFGSVVLDLSRHGASVQQAYLQQIAAGLLAQRAVTGLPHWIFFDEAHALPLGLGVWADALAAGDTGFFYSTYRPAMLPDAVRDAVDLFVLTAGEGTGAEEARAYIAGAAGLRGEELALAAGSQRGRALLIDAEGATAPVAFQVAERSSGHVRHWHKYIHGELPESLRFYFEPHDVHRVAANLGEFHHHLEACPIAAFEQHARRHDFSSWIRQVLQDVELAAAVGRLEYRLCSDERAPDAVRDGIRLAIEARYFA